MKLFSRKKKKVEQQVVPQLTEFQLMVQKFYAEGGETVLRLAYDLDQSSIVFDLGGYEGQWSSDIYSRYRSSIYLFEPVAEFANKISKRFERNSDIKVFEFGLGDKDSREIIYMNQDGSSIYGESDHTTYIEILDVSNWLIKNDIKRIDLMKINIEGGEYGLLERLISTDQIKHIKDIQVQFHNIEENSRSRMEKIQANLAKTHHLTYQYDFVWENWRLNE